MMITYNNSHGFIIVNPHTHTHLLRLHTQLDKIKVSTKILVVSASSDIVVLFVGCSEMKGMQKWCGSPDLSPEHHYAIKLF